MIPWCTVFFCGYLGLRFLWQEIHPVFEFFGFKNQQRHLQEVANTFREIEETLMVGLVPSAEKWESLGCLFPPWGELSFESLQELRQSGASLLPTLQRLRLLSEDHMIAIAEAKSKSAQALSQAFICSALVPVLGGGLYLFLPSISQNLKLWLFGCFLALIATSIGAFWMVRMSEVARWGGLASQKRNWILGSLCAGEKFLALVRTGMPVDLAWSKSCEFLGKECRDLAAAWGYSIWDSRPAHSSYPVEQVILKAGDEIRKAVQVSLMEGRPCLDRVETALYGLKLNLKAQVDRELNLLATKALKPLFICVAPALLGLLFFALGLTASSL